MQQAWKDRLVESGIREDISGVELQRAVVDKTRGSVTVYFTSDRLPDAKLVSALRRGLMELFSGAPVAVRVSCPQLADDFVKNAGKYASALTAMLSVKMPAAASHLRGAEWSAAGAAVRVSVAGQYAADYLTSRNAPGAIAALVKEMFNIDVRVEVTAAETVGKLLELSGLREARARQIAEQVAHQSAAAGQSQPVKRAYDGDAIFGKKVVERATPMRELTDMSGRVVIEGAVLQCETKPLKNSEKVLLIFVLTDETNSIACKVFLKKSEAERAALVKPGMHLRAKGEVSYDTFSHDLAMVTRDVCEYEPERRRDDAADKRIELHAHTNMSSMDAVESATELIKRAASWGHSAIAITDHGVVQAFPEAFGAAKKAGIKLLPGLEGYLTDDLNAIAENSGVHRLDGDFVVVDMEMTVTNAEKGEGIELGAVKVSGGKIVGEYTSLINPHMPIPQSVSELTGITDEQVASAPDFSQVIKEFADFAGNLPICAHDVHIDAAFIRKAAAENGVDTLSETLVDTLAFARAILPDAKNHKLDTLRKELHLPDGRRHRAIGDARTAAHLLLELIRRARADGAETLADLNSIYGLKTSAKGASYHIILLAKNTKGMENLFHLVSYSHLDYFGGGRPRIPRSILTRHREGIIVGSACEAGELYRAFVAGKPQEKLRRIAEFYDYLEIQPIANNAYMLRNGTFKDEGALVDINRRIYRLGCQLGKPVVATGDVHFLDPQDAVLREIAMRGKGFDDADQQPPLYLKTTGEMLEEFSYLGEEAAREVVIEGPKQIADMVEVKRLFPEHPEHKATFQPELPHAAEEITRMAWENARARYGEPLPDIVKKRLDKELGSIIGNGFATLYYSAHLLVKRSNQDGYLVGSRGSVGSSFAAHMCGITEVNPLPPHYCCHRCRYSDFDVDTAQYSCGTDMPEQACPKCGAAMAHDGYDIPFEVFLGFKGEKVPDIDLNFSGDYQLSAQNYVKTMFGAENVFKAGTASTLGEKKAYGYVKKFLAETGRNATEAEVGRLVGRIKDIKYNTGQHPAGMVIVPQDYSIFQFTPIQNPADKAEKGIITTHFDFNSLHDLLVKLDVLGHDDPTMIRTLQDLTGIDPTALPINDPDTMEIFRSTASIGVSAEELGFSKGSLGIPEFGTKFVIGMLDDTNPTTMEELIRISGLSHGTDVWLGNAQELIRSGTANLRQCICTRDDIMNYLIAKGAPALIAFSTMENVRKGKGLTEEMEKAMHDADVPEWFIDSCKKIKYMFPRAHAVAYVTMALRIAWFKVHRPLEYYAAYYTVRADDFDASVMCTDRETVKQAIHRIKALGKNATGKDESSLVALELVYEMMLRGIAFAPMDVYQSEARRFRIVDGRILPPLNALPGVGDAAAEAIVEARGAGRFISAEDLLKRAKVSKSVVETLRVNGCLGDMPDTGQVRLI